MKLSEARRIIEAYSTQHGVDSFDADVEPPSIDYGLRRVKDKVFFWRARRPIAIGARVPPFSGRLWEGDPHRTWMEAEWEKVRKRVAPGAPGRLGSVMVCPVLGKGFCSPKSQYDDPDDEKYVYAVRATGKAFTASAEMWTEAAFKTGPYTRFSRESDPKKWVPTERDGEELERWARSFWKGAKGYDYIETYIDGRVEVLARVDPKTGSVIESRDRRPHGSADGPPPPGSKAAAAQKRRRKRKKAVDEARLIVLTEVLDDPARWRWDITPSESFGASASFVIGDAEYTVLIAPEVEEGTYYVSFQISGHADPEVWDRVKGKDMGITGTGEQFRVFATVIDVLKKFDKKFDVQGWSFTANEPKRQRLYATILRRFAGRHGFMYSRRGKDFKLVREPVFA